MNAINHNIFSTDPLDEVAKQFEQWRSTRNKRGPIPEALRVLIQPLEGRYSPNTIVKALRINHSQLKNCFNLNNQKPLSQSMNLIECSAHIAPSISVSQGVTLSFSCKNGKSVILNGLHGNDIFVAISALIKE